MASLEVGGITITVGPPAGLECYGGPLDGEVRPWSQATGPREIGVGLGHYAPACVTNARGVNMGLHWFWVRWPDGVRPARGVDG